MAELHRAALIALVATVFFAGSVDSVAATNPVVQAGSDWAHLTPTQRQFLTPFAEDWDKLPEVAKLKWIGLADRYPKMTPAEQANVRDRMQDWSKLTPQERTNAREQYKKLRAAPAAERKQLEQKWREYEALPIEQKQALKTAPKPPLPSSAGNSALNQAVRPPKAVTVAPRTIKPKRQAPPAQQAATSSPQTPSSSPQSAAPLEQSAPTEAGK